jgi:5-methylcytosine-specific restriction endonuclease McrA
VAKNTGKKHSPETLAKIKVVNATKAKRGSESHLWKGGIDSDPLHRLERQRRWYRENPGRAKLIGQKRRALKRGGGPLSLKTVQMVYEDNIKRFGTLTCIYCLDPISFGSDELEHRMPLARGGTNEYGNLAVACHKCNATKRHKTEEEFVEWRLRRDK